MDLSEIAEAFLQIQTTNALDRSIEFDMGALSIGDAYEVQRQVIAAREARNEQVVGYKVGCTSAAIRKQFGLSEPICGRLMAPHVHYGCQQLNYHDYVNLAVEPEFVMRIGRDVSSAVEDDGELVDAIEWVAAGIEVHNFKFWFGEPTSQELIASNGIHAGLVVGDERVPPRDIDFDREGVELLRNGQPAASGIGADIMGGPLKSLRWLVGHLGSQRQHLRAGQLVIPGSPVKLVSVRPGDRIEARFSRIGSVEAEFTA